MFSKDLFNYFQHIEQLKLGFLVDHIRNLEAVRNYIRKVFEGIGHQLHPLQYLYLDFTLCCDSCTIDIYLCDNLPTTLCDRNRNLEVLHLNNVLVSNEMLLNLCYHPKLHTLNLSGRHLHKHLTEDRWISFTRKLKEQQQTNSSTLQGTSLACTWCNGVTDQVLEELAGVESLKTLRIGCNPYITDKGINEFASANEHTSKSRRVIELYHLIIPRLYSWIPLFYLRIPAFKYSYSFIVITVLLPVTKLHSYQQ